MTTAIIVFLAAVCAVLTAAFVILFSKYRDMSGTVDAMLDYIDKIDGDKKQLIDDKREMYAEIGRLKSDNDTLADAVRALRKRNSELVNINKELTSREPAAISQQEDDEIAADEVLQANAIFPQEPLPEGHTNVISGMPYTTITNKRSEQWALQLQAFTGKYGIRCYFDGDHIYFLAAMGSAYGRTIGDTFRVTLRCGTELYVMLAEYKDDGTDPNFFGHPTKHADGYDVTRVLEFIYDAEHINSKALQAGNFCNIEHFGGLHGDGGDIAKIEYLGRKWKP